MRRVFPRPAPSASRQSGAPAGWCPGRWLPNGAEVLKMSLVTAINRERLAALVKRERGSYAANFPRSRAAFDGAGEHLVGGVPMTWMRMWAGGFPAYQATAHGAR